MLYQTENPHGGDVYAGDVVLDFSANINPLGTPPGVLAAMCAALRTVGQYPDPYCRELVTALAALEGVAREDVLCGNGAAELIGSYCAAVRPACAVELAPTFGEYSVAVERVGGRVERYALKKAGNFTLGEEFCGFLEETRPEVVFLCNPNNPTGRLIGQDVLEKILVCCQTLGARVFLDECFLDFTDGVSAKAALRRYKGLFILKAFTKSYALAGARVGYGLCAEHTLLAAMARTVQPWNVSGLAQAAGVAATREGAFLQEARALVARERQWMHDALTGLGFWGCPGQANYLLFQARPGLDGALRECGIAIRNCANYHGLGQGWYRVAVRTHAENMRLIAAMEETAWQKTL